MMCDGMCPARAGVSKTPKPRPPFILEKFAACRLAFILDAPGRPLSISTLARSNVPNREQDNTQPPADSRASLNRQHDQTCCQRSRYEITNEPDCGHVSLRRVARYARV